MEAKGSSWLGFVAMAFGLRAEPTALLPPPPAQLVRAVGPTRGVIDWSAPGLTTALLLGFLEGFGPSH